MKDYHYGTLVRFKSFNCPYCKSVLPVEIHYENRGLVRVFCRKCGKCIYIKDFKVLKG